MKIFKNIIEDAMDYNQCIAKYNQKNKEISFEPITCEKVITITLEEYKELLIYKGKYLETLNTNVEKHSKIIEKQLK